jgi:hypothetical protein
MMTASTVEFYNYIFAKFAIQYKHLKIAISRVFYILVMELLFLYGEVVLAMLFLVLLKSVPNVSSIGNLK